MNKVEHYKNITREQLDSIKIGDKVLVNNWKEYLIVKGVSLNYIVMCKGTSYSIIHKDVAEYDYNSIKKGEPYCGPDNSNGCYFDKDTDENGWDFENEKWVNNYLEALEDKNNPLNVSLRNSIPIKSIKVKRYEQYFEPFEKSED